MPHTHYFVQREGRYGPYHYQDVAECLAGQLGKVEVEEIAADWCETTDHPQDLIWRVSKEHVTATARRLLRKINPADFAFTVLPPWGNGTLNSLRADVTGGRMEGCEVFLESARTEGEAARIEAAQRLND